MDFIQSFVTRRSRRPAQPCGSCLVLDEIRRRRGCEISVNMPRIFAEEKRIKAFVGFAPQ